MSHVTTSASLMATGPGRGELAPGTQLASNERFQDFLESYVHPKTPAHAQVSQKNTTDKPHALKAGSSDNKSSSQLPKTKAPAKLDRPVAKKNEDAGSDRHVIAAKSNVAAKDMPSGLRQKGESVSSDVQNKEPKNNPVKIKDSATPEKYVNNKPVFGKEDLRKDSKSEASEAAYDYSTSLKSSGEDASIAEPEPTSSTLSTSPVDPEQKVDLASVDDTGSSPDVTTQETSAQKEKPSQIALESIPSAEDADESKSLMSVENIARPPLAPISEENSSIELPEKTSPATQPEKMAETTDSEEQISRHAEQQPLLYQKINNGNETTHIEMNIGNHEKVHVEIGENTNKEHRIHINTDNPEVYQSLKDDRDTLLATITQNSLPVADLQSIMSADIQISLSAPSFLDMSSNGERQEGNNQPSGSTRGASSASTSPAAERRVLRGVVDLTV